ncbi:hypothetical protein C8R47DRAFT_1084608 [Mycena vitilis]|nr:hypothetical protein C8R47DRAFT_1084608 [Mycena vitilis]
MLRTGQSLLAVALGRVRPRGKGNTEWEWKGDAMFLSSRFTSRADGGVARQRHSDLRVFSLVLDFGEQIRGAIPSIPFQRVYIGCSERRPLRSFRARRGFKWGRPRRGELGNLGVVFEVGWDWGLSLLGGAYWMSTFDATKAHPALPASIAHRARAACALTLPVPRRTNGAVWGTPNGAGGEGARTDVGRWFGPSAAAGELRNLVDDFRLWATLHRTEIFAASHSPHSAASSSMTSVSSFLEPFACASESKGEQVWGSAGVTPAGRGRSSARFLNPLVSRADAPTPSLPSLFIGVQGDGLSILPQPSPLTPLRPSMGDLSSIPRRRLHPAMDMGPPTDKYASIAASDPKLLRAHAADRRTPRATSTTAHDRARAPPTGGHLIPAEQMFYVGAYSAVEQSTFHCERVGKMPLSGLDTSIADWLPRPIFTIQDEPRTWPGADDDDDMGLKRVSDPDEEELRHFERIAAPPPPGNEHAVCDAYTDLEGEDSFVNPAPVCKQAGLEGEGEELEPQGGRRAVAADVRTGERTEREHIVTVSLSRVAAAGVGQRVHTARGARDGGRTHSDVLKED